MNLTTIKDKILFYKLKILNFYDFITTDSETGENYVLTYGVMLIAIKLIFDACYNFYYTVNFIPRKLMIIGGYIIWYDPMKNNKTIFLVFLAFTWLSLDIFLNTEKTENEKDVN